MVWLSSNVHESGIGPESFKESPPNSCSLEQVMAATLIGVVKMRIGGESLRRHKYCKVIIKGLSFYKSFCLSLFDSTVMCKFNQQS